jgi:hypothetical protein
MVGGVGGEHWPRAKIKKEQSFTKIVDKKAKIW